MEQHERQVVVDQLSASRDRLLSLTEAVTPQQWSFHPAEGSWSIGDCLEHVTRVENRILGVIQKKLEEAPEPEKQDPTHSKDGLLAQLVPDRTEGRKAPEHAHPTREWSDPQQLVQQFLAVRERTSEFASTTDRDLRSHFIPHGAFGELDCYQWLLVLAFHGERHARQIEEIKQSLPGKLSWLKHTNAIARHAGVKPKTPTWQWLRETFGLSQVGTLEKSSIVTHEGKPVFHY